MGIPVRGGAVIPVVHGAAAGREPGAFCRRDERSGDRRERRRTGRESPCAVRYGSIYAPGRRLVRDGDRADLRGRPWHQYPWFISGMNFEPRQRKLSIRVNFELGSRFAVPGAGR